ncbi:alpha/beta fold hydrolase [Candidatus Formimonas warabiya]|uniref:Alpha/beta hydrolase n=1 Tax=Formimonas warabiya TaxID=1761012 RepID=A0A3G1KRI6_FORW1|nr:alpha/beta hydrolase [Candidatus Formimonas warabiya]ATW25092.1 alpha/beta hydrolase [Candidatus Formimonas warabiya]
MDKRFKSPEGKRLIYESYDKLLGLWGVNKKELDIETQYGKTHVIICGNSDNPPLILFHGSGDNSVMTWFPNIREFVHDFYVVAVDYFGGAGKSEPNDSYLKEFNVVLWVDKLLDTLGIAKTNIAGVSYGGYLTLAYTAKHPDRVNKIICMANYPYVKSFNGYFLSYLLVIRAIKILLPEIFYLSEENAINILRRFTAPSSDVPLLNVIEKPWFYLLKYSKVVKQKMTYFDSRAINIIRNKALFLIGDSDRLIYHTSVINLLKNNSLNYKIIENTGHIINYEKPELINKEITTFLLT